MSGLVPWEPASHPHDATASRGEKALAVAAHIESPLDPLDENLCVQRPGVCVWQDFWATPMHHPTWEAQHRPCPTQSSWTAVWSLGPVRLAPYVGAGP